MRPARVLSGLGIGAMAGFLMAQLAGKASFFGRSDSDLIFDTLWVATAAGTVYWVTEGATSLAMIWSRGALLGAALWLGYFVQLRILSETYPSDAVGEGGAIIF